MTITFTEYEQLLNKLHTLNLNTKCKLICQKVNTTFTEIADKIPKRVSQYRPTENRIWIYIFLVTVSTVCVTLFTYSAPVQLGKAAESIFEVQHPHRADSLLPQTNRLFTGKWRAKGTWSLPWFLNHGARNEGSFCILYIAEIRYFVEIEGSVCKQKNQDTYLTRAPTQNCKWLTTTQPGTLETLRNKETAGLSNEKGNQNESIKSGLRSLWQ